NGGVLTMDKVSICNGTGIGLDNTGTFIMNDGEISGNGSQGVYIWRGTFTMNGGIISGNNLSNNDMRGGGVFVESNAEFEMTGGEISGNSVLGKYASGGGVYNSGTFKMSGGIIKDNSVSGEGAFGGGVYTGPGFEMTGGEISGNSASGEGANGGGVYANSAVFSNNPVITDNKLGENKVNNCYFESTLYIGGELTDGAKIGISKEESESSTPTLCTGNINYQLKTSDVSKFISDDENRVLDLDEDGCAYLVDGYIVKFDSDGGSAVLKQGVAIGAKATKPEAPIKKDNLFVAWYKVDAEGNIAENAYDFDKIVENSMILKAKWAPVSVSIMSWTYGDTAKSPTVTKPENSGAVTYEYFTDEECTDKTGTNNGATVEGGVPKNTGKYYVKATIAASEKYGNGSTIASFEIAKKEVIVSGIVAKNKTYDTTTAVEFDFESAQFDGVIDGDEVIIKSVEGVFDDANVADNKNVTISKIILDGSSIGNYKLATEGQQKSAKANVNTKVVDNPVISFSDENIVYDGEEKEPSITVKDGTTVIPSSEYTVSYSNNKNAAVRTAQNAPTITITDKTSGNYKVNGKATFTIAKASVAPNKPEATKEVVYTVMTVSNVELPEKWVWSDEHKDNELIVGEGVTATANYIGEDKDNYETVNAEVVITRAACTHDGEKQIKNVVQASCNNDGYTGDTYCVVCGEKLEEGKTVPATGHFTNDLFEKQTKDVEDIALKVVEETPTPVVQKKEEVTVEDKTSEVTEIKKDSFKGSKATTVTIGKDVTTLAPGAFNGSKIKTVIIKSKKLTKKSVRNAFKGTKVKKIIVKVKVGSKKENKKYVKKYKKFFTKKNIGVKAVVK
ncbi:MAG: InlB B-repeat-containing protein, partial [Lachnospiraceae bacterium]|nr:InlB B-repeat-containing protein [Lachnospiraceae bacterium]